jgi:hypothetical protein
LHTCINEPTVLDRRARKPALNSSAGFYERFGRVCHALPLNAPDHSRRLGSAGDGSPFSSSQAKTSLPATPFEYADFNRSTANCRRRSILGAVGAMVCDGEGQGDFLPIPSDK